MAFKMKYGKQGFPYKTHMKAHEEGHDDKVPEGSTRETGRGDNKYSETYIDGNWVIDDGTHDNMNIAKNNEIKRRMEENKEMRAKLTPEEYENWATETSEKRNF